MRTARDIPRERFHRSEGQKILLVLSLAKCVPGGQSVEMNFGRGDGRFQKLKRRAHSAVEHLARDLSELRFRIVQVIDVNGFNAQIATAALELVSNKARRHRMATGSHVSFAQNSRGHILLIEIFARVGGHVAIGSQESALGANQKFLPRKSATGELGKSCSN